MTVFPGRQQQYSRTAAQLAAENPFLARGELCLAEDTGILKIGPGFWTALEPLNPPAIDINDLPAATSPLGGDELFAGLQDGVATKFTAEQVAGGLVETYTGVARDRYKGAEDFESIRTAITTNAAVVTGARMMTSLTGTGAQVAQGQDPLSSECGIADLSTGTTATGRCALVGAATPLLLFGNTMKFRVGIRMRMPAVSDGTNTYVVRGGFTQMDGSTPTDGFYFQSPTAAGDWLAVLRDDSADLASIDTNVAVDTNFHAYVVEWDPVTTTFRWYIDGVLVGSEATLEPDANAPLTSFGVGIFKSAGTTARILEVDYLSWDIPGGRNLFNLP